MILQLTGGTSGALIDTAARIVGTAILAGFLAAAVSLGYRWYVRERVPAGLALLVGLAGVALVAGTTSLLAQELAPGGADPDALAALGNVITFLVGGLGAYTGMRIGDALGVDLFAATGGDRIDGEVSELVRTVGRVISVEVPEDIGDIVGYDPVPETTKEKLAGHTVFFPRRLTQAELRERFVSRLKTDYGVGHVDVEFDETGGIDYLALGSRAAGIGPTLPPATNAVAIRADPAHAASAGDLVQVWETNPMGRVLTGELRGVAGEVVTVAIDAADTPKLDPTTEYKLVTLPVQDRPDREFASLLRAADETLATITVQPGSRADGMTVSELGVTVAAITREDEPPTALPDRDRALRGGDVLYAIATPDALRKLEAAAEATEGITADDAGDGETPAAEPADATASAPTTGDGDANADQSSTQTAVESATDEPATEEPATSGEADGEHSGNDAGQVDDGGTAVEADTEDGNSDENDDGDEYGDSDDEASTIPSGDAFPDTDDLPGMSGDVAASVDEIESSDESGDDDSIPDTAAFPDTDDLPGATVSTAPGADDADDADTDPSETTDDEGSDEGNEDQPADSARDRETEADDPDDGANGSADGTDDDTGGSFADLLEDGAATDDDGLDELLADDPEDEETSDER